MWKRNLSMIYKLLIVLHPPSNIRTIRGPAGLDTGQRILYRISVRV
jgi:hypothetical protein